VPDPASLQGAQAELTDIGKSFGAARALEAVSLRIARGSIHALVGENGAGKSTLGKILAGVIAPDHGQFLLDGEPAHFHSPREAIARGIVLIAQELSLVPALSVAENVFLGTEPRRAGFLRRHALHRRYEQMAGSVGFDLPADAPVGRLRVADQQKVEIMRALSRDARLIVMDEPTAALSRPDVDRLHGVIRRLAADGTTVVLVSHFLREVLDLADQVTVLRDGQVVRTAATARETEESLLNAMLGRTVGATFPARQPPPADAPPVLSSEQLTVRAGEIVGLAGLVGAGRSELAHALFGRPRRSLASGIAMIPESRKEQGLLLGRSVTENVSLASLGQLSRFGLVRPRAERTAVARVLAQATVNAGQAAPASTLSGGNQQKLLFARCLLARPRLLIADEPTRGVDVGAKRAIYELLAMLAADGLGVLLISSDVEEILGLAHRVLVMRLGKITAELTGDGMTEAAILAAAFDSTDRDSTERDAS
jgi:ribose transport system ATP-binding protein